MGDLALVCQGCGRRFVWTEKEQVESTGHRVPDTKPIPSSVEFEPYCKSCRPKQDQQRS